MVLKEYIGLTKKKEDIYKNIVLKIYIPEYTYIEYKTIKRTGVYIMQIIKLIILLCILTSCIYIGILISKKYLNRVKNLKELKIALNILETKIKFTYEPLPKVFKEISEKIDNTVGKIFELAAIKMKDLPAGDAWIKAIEEANTNLNKDDLITLNGFSNLLGKVDIEGQVNEIELLKNFIDKQLNDAEEEKNRYGKMYKSLGITIGLAIVIILI